MKSVLFLIAFLLFNLICFGQRSELSEAVQKYGHNVPSVFSGIMPDNEGGYYFVSVKSGDTAWMVENNIFYTLENIQINPKGTDKGLLDRKSVV